MPSTSKLLEQISAWVERETAPVEMGRDFFRCPVCQATWTDKPAHHHDCWVWRMERVKYSLGLEGKKNEEIKGLEKGFPEGATDDVP